MREIKFRAWDNTKQQMFPVRELFWRENPYEMVGNYWFFENEDDEYGKEVWFPRTDANGSKHTAHLMQYTGLSDKQGKPIYEGDIVKSHTPFDHWADNLSIVKYEDGSWNYSYALQEFSDNPEKDWEIIGNIYDNPELVKGEGA